MHIENSYSETAKLLFSALVLVLLSVWALPAQAIPAFARENQLACSVCHTAWPALNDYGRKFKENGYRFAPLQEAKIKITKELSWGENFPISTIIVGRPYDKTKNGNTKARAIHEVELMVGGPMNKELSGFFEIEAEDEDTNARGLELGIPTAALTYTVNPAVNIQLSWADLLWFDPYNSYTSGHRMTRNYNSILEESFGGADNGADLRTSRQNLTLYGRPFSNLFYGVSFSGVADDSEGEEPDTLSARVAYEITPAFMVGGLVINGTCSSQIGLANCTVDRDYRRYAFDLEINQQAYLINAAYMQAKDDNTTATAEVENNAFYIRGLYTFRDNGRPIWAPLVRFDVYEKVNGTEDITEVTAGVNYFFNENFRSLLEFWKRNGEGTTADDDRLTLQVYAAF